MSKGFKDKEKKFHPITPKKNGVRKSRDQTKKTKGVRLKKDEPFKVQKTETIPQEKLIQMQRADVGRRALDMGMSVKEMEEWEHVAGSEIVKVKHEMLNGKPITSVRFANGEEWFEFDNVSHQEEFIKLNEIEIDHEKVGEFVEIDHPMIAGYVSMSTGKIVFGEREDRRMSKDGVKVKPEFKKGQIVMVAPDNDNENYDSFKGKKLRITHVAVNIDQHQGFDEGVGEALYDFETLDGEPVPNSLYDYELVKA